MAQYLSLEGPKFQIKVLWEQRIVKYYGIILVLIELEEHGLHSHCLQSCSKLKKRKMLQSQLKTL